MGVNLVIVGAAGQLGSAIVTEFQKTAVEIIALRRGDLDVRDEAASHVLRALRPDVIINASAWNDVDGAEVDPAAAFAVNCAGVRRLAHAPLSSGAVFVHYSSEFVFDGRATEPYSEGDLPAPINCYGRSKLAGER